MIEFLNTLNWQHTIPAAFTIISIVFIVAFREPISASLQKGNWKTSIGSGKIGFSIEANAKAEAVAEDLESLKLPESINGVKDSTDISDTEDELARLVVITEADVVTEFGRILSTERVQKYKFRAWLSLIRNGVITKQELTQLVNSEETLRNLAHLYIEVLQRDTDAPLDPMAVATWGAFLYKNGLASVTIESVRKRLQLSDEYKRKHGQASN